MQKKNGYSEDSKPIVFDKETLSKNYDIIEYLYGQLQDVHTNKSHINPFSITLNYDNKTWASDKGIILEFLHLGYSAHLFNAFSKNDIRGNNDSAVLFPIKPTLSPKDPNFPAWWEEHKSEWETPTNSD